MSADLIARLRSTLPVCPFSSRSPDYWTAGENGAPCTVCGTTEDGPDKCRGADTRCMEEAADALAAKDTALSEAIETRYDAVTQALDANARVEAAEAALSEMRAELETERYALGHEIRIKSEAIADYRRARKALEDIRKQDRVTRFRGTEQQFYEDGPCGKIAARALAPQADGDAK